MNFDNWLDQVDTLICDKLGLSLHDLEDSCYYDWFDSGMTPRQACKLTIKEVMS